MRSDIPVRKILTTYRRLSVLQSRKNKQFLRIKKYKARFCVRGDKQIQGVDVFDTYAPVVGWSTGRMMLTMAACLKWESVQVDFDAAFVHATLPPSEQVYLEMPQDFDAPTSLPKTCPTRSEL